MGEAFTEVPDGRPFIVQAVTASLHLVGLPGLGRNVGIVRITLGHRQSSLLESGGPLLLSRRRHNTSFLHACAARLLAPAWEVPPIWERSLC